jgi:predicted peptidase
MKKLIGKRMLSLVVALLMCMPLGSGIFASAAAPPGKPTVGIQSVTGITTILTFGQKVTAIAVEYPSIVKPQPIEDPENLDTYAVKDSWYDFRFDNVSKITSDIRDRTITRMYTNDQPATIPDGVSKPGRFVIVELSPLDYGGNTVRTNPASSAYVKIMTGTEDMQTQIIQNRPVLTADGVVLGTPLGAETPTVYRPSAWLDPLADQFQYGVYCCQGSPPNQVDLPYYYYIPPDLEPGHVYPMVVILPGQGMGYYNGTNPIGANPKVNVVADIPATAWMQPAWTGTDEKVIVLAPQSRRTGAAAEATAALGLIDQFMAAHPEVDAKRLYFSTVSYGSTTAWAMMQQRPGVFAAGLLTGGFAVSATQATAIATARPLTPIYITHGLHDPLLRINFTGYLSRDRLRAAYVATGLVDADGAAALIPFEAYDTPSYFNQVVPQVPGYAEPDNHAVMGPTYTDTSKLTWLLSQVKP